MPKPAVETRPWSRDDELPEPGDLRRAAKHLARAERILYRAQPMSAVQLRGMIKQLKNRAKLLEAMK